MSGTRQGLTTGISRIFILLMFIMSTGHAEDLHPAATLVKQTANKMLERLRDEREALKKDPTRVTQLVEEVVLPHFDFETMSASVLGKYWRRASPDQRARFREEFKTLLLRTYANSLVGNMDKTIDYEPIRESADATNVTVRTSIPQDGGFPLPINYSMEKIDNEWKVYDVEIDGISLVKNYRSTFSKEVQQSGLDQLIKTLSERNKDMTS